METSFAGFGVFLTLVLIAAVIAVVAIAVRHYRRRSKSPESTGSQPSLMARDYSAARTSDVLPMAGDIFLSYAAPDRPTAQTLADVLSAEGWSVWWDRTIPPGQTFDQVIESALDSAKCVIVLWSKASVHSDWVKVEAAEGARRRILVPALIEEVTIPLEFRRIQAAVLVDWHGSTPHPGYESLVSSVARILGKADISSSGSPRGTDG